VVNSRPVVVLGVGEIGGVFARGFLRCGHPVHPVTRSMDTTQVAMLLQNPLLVLIAVGEDDLQDVLSALPEPWRDRLVLIQNELLPHDWQSHGLSPTVISVWFEKKRGQDVKIVVPSVVFGPYADETCAALTALEIPCQILGSRQELLFELVRKNLYILVSNLCGLEVGGTVGGLWSQHRELARAVAEEILDIQQTLVETPLDREPLIAAMVVAFEGDPDHKCMGRSAPARLARALANADKAGLPVPTLRRLQA